MPNPYTEADYENSIIELFRNELGYEYAYGSDVERDFYSPLYEEVLEGSLFRINRGLPYDALQIAISKLKEFDNGELVQKNAVFMDYLQNGIPVRYFVKGEERSSIVYIVDYQNIDNNSFIKEALMLHQALSLCASLVSEEERYEAAFFEAVRALVVRLTNSGSGHKISLPEMNARINEFLKQSIKSTGVINLFSDVKEEISLFDPKLLQEISNMK